MIDKIEKLSHKKRSFMVLQMLYEFDGTNMVEIASFTKIKTEDVWVSLRDLERLDLIYHLKEDGVNRYYLTDETKSFLERSENIEEYFIE